MHDILIVGIATVDAIARPIDRFPAPGGLRFFDQVTFATGGCAVNCSISLAKLGIGCDLVTRVGRDVLGDLLLSELDRHGVPTAGVRRDAEASTAFTFVAVGSDGERRFLHTVGTDAAICRADIPDGALAGRKIVLVTGTMLMDTLDGEQTAGLLAEAQAAGAITLLDTVYVESAAPEVAPPRPSGIASFGLLRPIPHRPARLTGLDDPAKMAAACQADGARNVAIKLGQGGAFCRDVAGRETVVPAFAVADVVDTTGAGDCWCAGFLVGLRKGSPIDQAACLGNAVAAHGIQAPGATAGVKPLHVIRSFMDRTAPGG